MGFRRRGRRSSSLVGEAVVVVMAAEAVPIAAAAAPAAIAEIAVRSTVRSSARQTFMSLRAT